MEPPYGTIWTCLKSGSVVPFLGAGASLAGRTVNWSAPGASCLPDGKELACFLANKVSFPSNEEYERGDLAKVSSYFEDISGRNLLLQQLHEILDYSFRPGEIHKLLASIKIPQVIVVTNYDTMLEEAFREAGTAFDLVVYPCDQSEFANAVLWWPHGAAEPQFERANTLDIDLTKTTVIFKMHGSIVRGKQGFDNFVVTEDDYVDFLSRMNNAVPKFLMRHFRSRGFLFLGYGLRDWNLRVVLKNVSRHLVNGGGKSKVRSWAIQKTASELERVLWWNRNVNIFEVDLDTFVAKLKAQVP
jgi:hypothetical protein